MTSQEAPKDSLQFDQAEPATTTSAGTACAACSKAIADTYHTINDQVLCELCRRRIEADWTGGSASSRAGKELILGRFKALTLGLDLLLVAFRSDNGDSAWQQVIPGVPVRNLHHVARATELLD